MLFVQVQQFGTGTRCGLETLHQCSEEVKTKSQNVFSFLALRKVIIGKQKFKYAFSAQGVRKYNEGIDVCPQADLPISLIVVCAF